MIFFLGALLLASAGFVAVLLYFDVTPRAALRELIGRFSEAPTNVEPVRHEAPYRRVQKSSNAVHKPLLLNLATSDGSGQACHPDVVYIPDGFGAKNWTYWMACTPYPHGNSAYENPEIFVSYDGFNWDIPEGLKNPLVQKPSNTLDHNSDPDILVYENELWLFYRETLRGKSPAENRIYLMKSADGVRWSDPQEVLSETTGSQLLSPAVLHDGSCFRMWTVEWSADGLKLMRRRSLDGINWSEPPEGAQITGIENGRQPWHIDVIREADRLSAVLVTCAKFGGTGSRIHYAHSKDGLHWVAEDFLLDQSYEFESGIQYRATLLKIDDRSQEYALWYSAASHAEVFSIAYLKMIRSGDNLVPSELQSLQSETLTALK